MELSPEEIAVAKARFRHWQTHPLDWVKDIFGDNIREKSACKTTETGLSTQQETALRGWGDLIAAKMKASSLPPARHHREADKKLRDALFAKFTDKEKELSSKIGMSIMSGTGTGKDFTASLLIFHFLMCFDMPKLLCTANTQKQLKDVLWSECSKIMRLSKKLNPSDPMSATELQNMFEWQSELIFAKPYKGKEWFARACTINAQASPEAQGETLAGRHEDFQLFVLDEASSIPESVWKPVEGTLTGRLNLVLLIFNPTRSSGFALRSQYEEKDKWLTYRWNSEDSEIVDPIHIENLAKYGKDSNAYRIRVLGLPPLTDSNTLISTDWIEDSIGRPFDHDQDTPIMAGIDVGGGGDKSVIAIRKGGEVLNLVTNNSKDTMQVADWVAETLEAHDVTVGFVDIIGIGRGVYDRLRQMGYNVRPFDSRARSKEPDRFYNARAELFWKLREQFEQKLICIPEDRDLIDQLNSIKFYPDEKCKIEKKSDIKKVVGHSPDQADALAISYAGNDYLFRKSRGKVGNKINYTGVYLR